MKITTDKKGQIIVQEIAGGIKLETRAKESFCICMRATGFEFCYNNEWYSAKEGKLEKIAMDIPQKGQLWYDRSSDKYIRVKTDDQIKMITDNRNTFGPWHQEQTFITITAKSTE